MKQVIIIHGCIDEEDIAEDPTDTGYDQHWIPWLKKSLMAKDIKVETPHMPNPLQPSYESFKEEFEKSEVSEETILIGHSCGAAFLVRWLGDSKKKINKLILVAPWKITYGNDESRDKFYNYDIDPGVRSQVKEVVIFTSDDEEEDGKKSVEIFHKALGGKIIELKDHGHYILRDMGTEEFPELLNEVLK